LTSQGAPWKKKSPKVRLGNKNAPKKRIDFPGRTLETQGAP
jgi:hypothetical protein